MKIIKKAAVVLMAAAMCFAASCGNDGSEASDGYSSTVSETGAVSEEKAEQVAEPAEEAFPQGATINGENARDSQFVYTYDSGYGHIFAATITVSDDLAVVAAAAVPDGKCSGDRDYSLSGLNQLDVVIGSAEGTAEYMTPDASGYFSGVTLKLGEFSASEQAQFYMEFTLDHNGTPYEVKAGGTAAYTAPAAEQASDVCAYCGGTGTCTVCNGLGYTMWGGADSMIDCSSCGGSGDCYYCQGTGTQVYAVRGVPVQ